jgi:hypothetical protein
MRSAAVCPEVIIVKRSSIAVCFGIMSLLASGCGSEVESGTTGSVEGAQVEGPYLTPAYWNVDALADSPSPGSEPINVILTTNLGMDAIVDALPRTRQPEQGLLTWGPVPIGVGLKGCISEELARIDGEPAHAGRDRQALSLRLGGVFGCEGVLADGESHARGWKSETRSRAKDAAGRTIETWYLALSQEHVCLVDINGTPKPWHCILPQGFVGSVPGINGKKFTAKAGGYDQGRDHFVANLKRLGDPTGATFLEGIYTWTVDCKSMPRASDPQRPNGGGAGEGLMVPVSKEYAAKNPGAVQADPRDGTKSILKRVRWDANVTHCAIMER